MEGLMEEQRSDQELSQAENGNSSEALFLKCLECNSEVRKDTIAALPAFFKLDGNSDHGKTIQFECPECSHYQTQNIDDALYGRVSSLINNANSFIEAEMASFGEADIEDGGDIRKSFGEQQVCLSHR
jgi:hypothetical protein